MSIKITDRQAKLLKQQNSIRLYGFDEIYKNATLNTLLSWFNRMAFDEIAHKKFNDCVEFEKVIFNVERYYTKYKCLKVPKAEADLLTAKLKKTQLYFEDLLTIKNEDGTPKMRDKDNIETIFYSPNALSVCALDYMLNIERDLSLRVKFSHINTSEMLMEIEDIDKELYYNTIKIFNKLVDRL